MSRCVVMIDGGHLRARARFAKRDYNPDFIESFAKKCFVEGELAIRFLYYDCKPFNGTVKLPISNQTKEFKASADWLNELATRDLFAVRLGDLKIRGFQRKDQTGTSQNLTDEDFRPVFEQKGVDMRIGLDIASYSTNSRIDKIVLVTADADCVPAMKYARKNAVQIVLIDLPNQNLVRVLREHSDYVRVVSF